MANFDKTGEASLGDCDVSGLSTTMGKDFVTDAEWDVLWEANSKRMFTHQAWPTFNPAVSGHNPDDPKEVNFFADNIDDAKTKLKAYYLDMKEGMLSQIVDTWFIKIYEGSDIRGMVSVMSAKFKDDAPTGAGYSVDLDSELQQLWTAQGQTGDYRDTMVVQNTIMGLPLADGTKTAFWYYSWYVQVATNNIMYAAIKPEGYDKMVQMMTGKVQKQFLYSVFEAMKQYGDLGTIPRGKYAGQTVEASPVWNYVDDNVTAAFTLGVRQDYPGYVDCDDSLKPFGWPFTTVKIGGNYPPYS